MEEERLALLSGLLEPERRDSAAVPHAPARPPSLLRTRSQVPDRLGRGFFFLRVLPREWEMLVATACLATFRVYSQRRPAYDEVSVVAERESWAWQTKNRLRSWLHRPFYDDYFAISGAPPRAQNLECRQSY